MGEGVLGFSLGATHSTGSSFTAALAGASAARTRSACAPRADRRLTRDTEETDAPEKPALRETRPEEAAAAAGATRAAHCACMRAAMVSGRDGLALGSTGVGVRE